MLNESVLNPCIFPMDGGTICMLLPYIDSVSRLTRSVRDSGNVVKALLVRLRFLNVESCTKEGGRSLSELILRSRFVRFGKDPLQKTSGIVESWF